jgi:glycosyltransferase involved in cell wall biosynthesis
MTSNICAVIPAYNAADTIQQVVNSVFEHVPHVLVADDGSTDDTARLAADAGAEVIKMEENTGKGDALKRLFRRADHLGYKAVISIDADNQHDPAEIPLFLETHRQYPDDIILGSRMHEKEKIPRARYNSMHIARFFVSLAANQYIEDTQCGFRLYPLSLIKKMVLTSARYVTETEILIKAGDMGSQIRTVKIGALYGAHTSHFRSVLDVDAITAYVISYLFVKWLKESVTDNCPYTYTPNNVRDRIGKNKFINQRFQTFAAIAIFPFMILSSVQYLLSTLFGKNYFASIRQLGCDIYKIFLATIMLPLLLAIATVESVINKAGFKARFTDRFIAIFYPDLWNK